MGIRSNSDLVAWEKAGEALAEADPRMFARLLELAERIVGLHRDPMSVRLPVSVAMASDEDANESG